MLNFIIYGMNKMSMKSYVYVLFFAILLMPFSMAQTQAYCISNQTVIINTSLTITVSNSIVQTNTSEVLRCPYGCDNATGGSNDCFPDPTDLTSFVLLPIIASSLAVLIFIYLSMQAKDKFELWLFFMFAGLFFLMLTLGMARSIAVSAGADSGTTLLMDAGIVLILAVYTIFMFYTIISYFRAVFESKKAKKFQSPMR